jgi:hypothetical protein
MELRSDVRLAEDRIEPMECAVDDAKFTRDARVREPTRVLDVFVMKKVEAADPDSGRG